MLMDYMELLLLGIGAVATERHHGVRTSRCSMRKGKGRQVMTTFATSDILISNLGADTLNAIRDGLRCFGLSITYQHQCKV